MTIEEIRELIGLVTATGVAELEVQRGDNRVRICQHSAAPVQYMVTPPAAGPGAVAHTPELAREPVTAKTPEKLHQVESPIVGTFYESSSPGSPAFVKPGDKVKKGQVLCIIESMKLMNEIESEVAGVVETRFVQNGQAVEFGEALFAIRPV